MTDPHKFPQPHDELTNPAYGFHECWMNQALNEAKKAMPTDVPVGAVLLWRNRIIAQAYNRREIDLNPVGHAEILVLQQGAAFLNNWRLQETQLYVTLEPCPMCASAIQQARVSRVVFGAYDPLAGACGSQYHLLMNNPTCSVIGGIQEEACSKVLKDFFGSKH